MALLGVRFGFCIVATFGTRPVRSVEDRSDPGAHLLEAGANCLPTAFLFLALGALAFALVPHAAPAIAYALVAATFVWETLGALLDAPGWLLALSPFHHVGLVPAEPFETRAALLMLAIATAAALAAISTFRRRDLRGA